MADFAIDMHDLELRGLSEFGKTQARRIAWRRPPAIPTPSRRTRFSRSVGFTLWQGVAAGDRLWVRETMKVGTDRLVYVSDNEPVSGGWATGNAWLLEYGRRKVPSNHMPRWASRFTLVVESTRIERLCDISEADAIAEGLMFGDGDGGASGPGYKWTGRGYHGGALNNWGGRKRAPCFHAPSRTGTGCGCAVGGPSPAQCAFREIWVGRNGVGSWARNPEVVVLTFHTLRSNIDALEMAA